MTKKDSAIVLIWEEGATQIKYKATPMAVNKSVQTGPKTQLGGLKLGLFIELYQLLSEAVQIAPKEPTRLHRTINPINRSQFICMLE